ncbi:hypothetical protein CHAB381_1760 [Campylobacter hominis ATCC BAA-381]|uniref:Uncharacterized protein n=1 Tax=Campylobacter hominis (strain ATCC BAA-381 / DSM 21671 / CCUG 45161 / LMG 19568 / NCTC 13146 / CH001A) TaxID=360107 RepID=A7I430_CAMHC|nr:hypothetical protein CHAB381_1760 [Campylobacter hominis ATCC BAA-381]
MIDKNSEISPLICFVISLFASSLNKFPLDLFFIFYKNIKVIIVKYKSKISFFFRFKFCP